MNQPAAPGTRTYNSSGIPPGIPPRTTHIYHRRWQAYALRRGLTLAAFLAWPAIGFALFALSDFWLHLPVLAFTLMIAWLGFALGLVWWQGEFRCPRCNRRYGAQGRRRRVNWTRGLFDKVCANCKLRKFERVEDPHA